MSTTTDSIRSNVLRKLPAAFDTDIDNPHTFAVCAHSFKDGLPKEGDTVYVPSVEQYGRVIGYYYEYGYIGVMVGCAHAPRWATDKQRAEFSTGEYGWVASVFGSECEPARSDIYGVTRRAD